MAVNIYCDCLVSLVFSRILCSLGTWAECARFTGYTVNLPELLAATSLDPESMGVLKENMVQFLAWVLSSVFQLLCLSWGRVVSPQVDGSEPKSVIRERVHRNEFRLSEQQPRLKPSLQFLAYVYLSFLSSCNHYPFEFTQGSSCKMQRGDIREVA